MSALIRCSSDFNIRQFSVEKDTSDPYLTIELNGHQIYKSHVYKEQLNPEFTEDGMILHPVSLQYIIQSERVVFRVKDYNKILANKFLGEASLNISNLLEFEPDTQPSKPGCKFKTPDGIQCVLKNIKTWEGPLQLVNNEQPSGQLYVKVTMHFKDFTPNWTPLRENIEEQPSVAAGENRTVEVESSNRKRKDYVTVSTFTILLMFL